MQTQAEMEGKNDQKKRLERRRQKEMEEEMKEDHKKTCNICINYSFMVL
jgi:hypothetical protein